MLRRRGGPVPRNRTQKLTQQACREQQTPGSVGLFSGTVKERDDCRMGKLIIYLLKPPVIMKRGEFIEFVLKEEILLSFP